MALESGTYINSLSSSNPASTDGLGQADDHLRLLKSTIKATFPNLAGAATADHTELSTLDGFTGTAADHNLLSGNAAAGVTSTHVGHLSGVSSNIQTQLNILSTNLTSTNNNLSSAVPTGMVMMWSGASSAIPSGYVLCDGSNSTPDLRDRFVVGAGSGYAVGNTGGSNTVSLTLNEIPSHSHTYEDKYVELVAANPGLDIDYNANTFNQNGVRNNGTGAAGGGASHENRPPYYALCYVMKT